MLFQEARENLDKISFPLVMLEYRLRLPLAPYARWLLSELPLHPLQVSLSLWENMLALCIMWHKVYGRT